MYSELGRGHGRGQRAGPFALPQLAASIVGCNLQKNTFEGGRMRDTDTPAPTQGREATMPPRRPREETARLGDEIYERDIRPQVEADHRGEYVAIDVDSGSWAISDDLRAAAKRLRTQHPGAIDVWLLRVGYRALHHFGGRPLRRAE